MGMNSENNSKTNLFKRVYNILVPDIPKAYKPSFKKNRLETNISRMYVFSIYIIVLQIVLNLINIVKPGEPSPDINKYIALSLGTLILGIIFAILFKLVKKGVIRNNNIKSLLPNSLLYIYTSIQLAFCTLNILNDGGINSYIIAILIIGLVPIISPVQSIITISASGIYIVIAMYLSRNISDMWNSILITDIWTNLIIITGLTVCISVFIYRMYVSNFLKSIDLQDTNEKLEFMVYERTKELEAQTITATLASQAKDEFLAKMSHEIRTPLNAIIGMTEVGRRSVSEEKPAYAFDEISKASKHLLDILNDILDMTKIETGQIELILDPFDLKTAAEEVVNIITLKAEAKKIKFISNIDTLSDISILGDKLRLKQILLNLLSNAVKFTPEEGRVDLSVNISDKSDSGVNIEFEVSDNGIGISDEHQKKLFTAFQTANEETSVKYGGTGLGLAISQNLVNLMGGIIKVESKLGKGSRFYFELNFKLYEKENTSDKNSDLNMNLSDKRILIVEDIEINSLILTELLAYTGIKVETAVDGIKAVEMYLGNPSGYYDLIFMDIQMPNMNGYDATISIRNSGRDDAGTIPIIAMTANAYRDDIQNAINSGMNAHLAKPINIEMVNRVLFDFLNRKQ